MRILIVGLGGIGQRHVRNIRALLGERAEIMAWRVRRLSHVVTPTLQSDASLDVEKVYGIRVFEALESALAERPQVAFICNPSSLHVPPALACLRAGCDLFLEKPVSHNLDGLAELMNVVVRCSDRVQGPSTPGIRYVSDFVLDFDSLRGDQVSVKFAKPS